MTAQQTAEAAFFGVVILFFFSALSLGLYFLGSEESFHLGKVVLPRFITEKP